MKINGKYEMCKVHKARNTNNRFYLYIECRKDKEVNIISETEKAIQVKNAGWNKSTGDQNIWIPKSATKMIDGMLFVAAWFVRKNNTPCWDRYITA